MADDDDHPSTLIRMLLVWAVVGLVLWLLAYVLTAYILTTAF